MQDRRRSFRRRTLLSCRLSARKLGAFADGTVRNLSETGARVSLPRHALLPHTFEVVLSDGEPRRARLVWVRDGAAGLALDPSFVQAAPAPERGIALGKDAGPAASPFEARLAAITARSSGQRT